MKNTFILVCIVAGLVSCKKDSFESVPKISFEDLKRNVVDRELLANERNLAPELVLKITDAEGDFGVNTDTDSSWIVIKHLLSNNIDSIRFPDLSRAPKNNFEAEVSVNLFDFIECVDPGPARPRVDTIYYEVYVRDWKNHKSNVITTGKPVLKTCN